MAVKQFPADYADITSTTTKLLASKADGTTGFALVATLKAALGIILSDVTNNVAVVNGVNIGIGTTLPEAKLDIINTDTGVSNSKGLSVRGGANSSGSYIVNFKDYSDVSRFFVRGDGNVGIGTASPTKKLDVNGDFRCTNAELGISASSSGISAGTYGATESYIQARDSSVNRKMRLFAADFDFNSSIVVSGNITASGTITPGSDKRLKSKIKTLDAGALDLIKKLNPVSYTLKSDKANSLGFIADEVRELFPDLILEGKDKEKMLAMNYMGLTAPIVKAIQEMSATITQLQERISVLEAR